MSKASPTEPLELRVSNLGPIAEAKIDLRPLTVFVGPSNTGKSYLAILIYALHRFFSDSFGRQRFGPMSRGFPSFYREHGKWVEGLSDDDVRKLLAWIDTERKNPADDSRVQLPDFVALWVQLVLRSLEDFSSISEEMGRSFGIEDAGQLIRHGSRSGAQVVLRRHLAGTSDRFIPFEYELTLKSTKSESVVSIPDARPLYLERDNFPYDSFASETRDALKSGNDNDKREITIEFIRSIVSSTVGPLRSAAHYLPADRTGVMHAHRVVVASLIQRASRGGLRRDTTLPALSGVLADFLEQLVALGGLPGRRRRGRGENLAERLEKYILKGAIRKDNSATGYPIFSYRPAGWKQDLPLMNSSSMVSELAPVVLYLRHVVQPGDVLIIEEPESHLHPAMQVEFIRQLAAIVRSGVRVMLTTHSEWVLDELANLVHLSELPKAQRKGIAGADFALSRDEVGAWRFEPKQRPKGSVVEEVSLDAESGSFPSGFDTVALGTYNTYAEISSRIMVSKRSPTPATNGDTASAGRHRNNRRRDGGVRAGAEPRRRGGAP